jgi:signal transduction histidine kinase
MTFEMTDVYLPDLIAKVVVDMQPLAEKQGLKLRAKFPKEFPMVYGDPTRLNQAISNLVHNAIRFTEKGSVTIKAEAQKDRAIVKVVDTGIGIPAKYKDKIFQKFFQVDRSPTRKAEGTGLGLSIAKGIVEAHGGRIWFKSRAGKGSTFAFSLPIKRQPKEKK